MNDLQMLAMIMGGGAALLALPCLLAPPAAREWVRDFPRSRVAGWLLSAVGVTWVTWLLFLTPLAWFDTYKSALYVLAPLFFLLVVTYMGELLAPRALGGLLILVPGVIVDMARQRGLLLVSLAYLMVVLGITLVLSPYLIRKVLTNKIKTDAGWRRLGLLVSGLGAGLAIVGFFLYK